MTERGPFTVGQMVGFVAQHFVQCGLEPGDAMVRAELGVAQLIAQRYVSEWGLTEGGELLYEPTPQVHMVYIVRTESRR